MKKIIAAIFCTLLCIFTAINTCASPQTYIIDEFGIGVSPPSGYYVLTKDVDENDPALKNFGYTKTELLELFDKEDICFITYSAYFTDEMTLYAYEVEEKSLSYYNEDELKDILNSDKEQLKALGANITDSEIYQNGNMTYTVLEYNYGDGDYCTDYFTVENNIALNLVCWSYGNEATTNQKQHYLSMVNSITFDTEKLDTDKSNETTTVNDLYDNISDYVSKEDAITIGISVIISIASLVLTLIAGIVVAIILIKKSKKRKAAALAQSSQPDNKFCIYCGTQLTADNLFCHVCGKKQNSDNT